jgi:hypothetical protein
LQNKPASKGALKLYEPKVHLDLVVFRCLNITATENTKRIKGTAINHDTSGTVEEDVGVEVLTIHTMNEFSLHSEIKKVYSLPGDKFEVKLGNYIVDILRDNLVIEVQTKNFSALRKKLQVLTESHHVRLVYPLPEKKWITHVTKDHVVLNSRKSPRKGRLTDLFGELVMIPHLIGVENFSLEVLFIEEEGG